MAVGLWGDGGGVVEEVVKDEVEAPEDVEEDEESEDLEELREAPCPGPAAGLDFSGVSPLRRAVVARSLRWTGRHRQGTFVGKPRGARTGIESNGGRVAVYGEELLAACAGEADIIQE